MLFINIVETSQVTLVIILDWQEMSSAVWYIIKACSEIFSERMSHLFTSNT